ncbi:Long-chain-fatty-acid--CoA ligase FadD13 (plasmid) [Variovorax sp. SRS16]|uniref:AMP-binding protein n=1 Tax=Variovorax sp. SRS16 TaxID=282217 RepID=UPI001316DE0B|nr:AMP-binding protein [Variovorax sp. SRS16]VTU45778.1 Long-chain-fatty-acid--CoA ligase FadD13 [Variovorax sp. SRS16]
MSQRIAPPRRISTGLTLGDLIERNARFLRDGVAFEDGARSLTHGRYHERVCRLAAALEARGCVHQDRIAMLAMNCIEYFELYGACEYAGFMAATVNYRLAQAEMLAILQSAAPAAFVFESEYAEWVGRLREQLPQVRAWVCIGPAPDWAEAYETVLETATAQGPAGRAEEDDIAHLIFTSGTTGKPKGCLLAHRDSVNKAQMHAAEMGISPADRMLLVMPYFHVGAKGLQIGALWRGATVLVQRQFEPARVLDAIEREKASILHLAPTMVQSVLDEPDIARRDLSSVRVLCYSAAPMPIPVLRKGLALMGNVFHQVYGQTEGAVSVLLRSQHRPDGSARERARLESVGQPLIGTDVRLVGEDGRDAAPGEAGEIVYRGGVMFRGYWNDMPATLQALRGGWIHSGDVGRFDEDGFLYIVDRKKDMVISGGENIYSREVEQALAQHPAVREAAVIGVPDTRWGEAVRAVVVLHAGAEASAQVLIDHCRTLIASYKKPRSVVFATELPKLNNGKIDKNRIRALHGAAAQDPVESTA